ncbi:isoaspartyl peptidase/L-asparaginase family protein [Portibacter lacus]|uniref:Isoaspartyl peptidase n=1 Tax=Portibacter lacus TaxID=1099794 RepID=A0AA37WBY3_9BACT|nr:isoaspartyl peptidase/L-asparaginase [Portibacter lacus]GLR15508.1 isoaspartyl peptidase/L-asparaginase [Portibacter lacus]
MRKFLVLLLVLPFLTFSCEQQETNVVAADKKERPEYAMVIHGGAGTILKANMSEEKDAEYRKALSDALEIGENILKNGGSSIDAVQKTINFMENSPLFNAGKGAVFTNAGINEMDASIMYGKDQNAGAIGGVTNIKNPINAARAVMEKSEHVMLSGKGAEEFAKVQGLEIVDPSYFRTENRLKALERAKAKEMELGLEIQDLNGDYKYGTVGAVALDKDGNLCAGTSTGGMTNKRYNRIGDAPIIGAGTFADNASCGVSSTGHGEFFIRYTVARDIAAMMEYKGVSLEEAGNYIINEKLVEKGGSGGVVALDKDGNISMPFNSEGMYRGYVKPNENVVKIYKNE